MSSPIIIERAADGLGAGGRRRRLGGHGEAEEGGALVDALEHAEDEPAQPGHRRVGIVRHQGDGVLQLVVHGLHAGAQEVVAVGEVDVHGRAGDAGFGCDLVHRHVGGAALAEEAARRVDQLVAPEVTDDVLERVGGAPGHRYLARVSRPAGSGADAGGRGERHGNVLDAIDELGL